MIGGTTTNRSVGNLIPDTPSIQALVAKDFATYCESFSWRFWAVLWVRYG